MKKVIFVLVSLALAAFPVTVYAGGGITNNPNHFDLDMNCEGLLIHATIPGLMSNGGHMDNGKIGHIRTHYIDFGDGFQLVGHWGGRGNKTIWCTWTWENDPYLHGMDIQFSPAK